MNMNEFVSNFANQFDETDPSMINADSAFRDFEEWSSLTGLSVLNMVEKKYGVKLSFEELRQAITIQDLYTTVQSKI